MTDKQHIQKIARILRVQEDTFSRFTERLEARAGRGNIISGLVEENEKQITRALTALDIERGCTAEEVSDALVSKSEADDIAIRDAIGMHGKEGIEMARIVCDFVVRVEKPQNGFFLKEETARALLHAEPPQRILKAIGYKTVEEMLAHENLLEVFSALRFLEDPQWLNTVFFRQYEKLTPNDFEQRAIQVRPLGEQWARAAEKFVAKKYHNVSHLKELGVIFVIPIFSGQAGETLRLISLLTHYLNEVKYYSNLFESFSRSDQFSANVISLLRGDVMGQKPEERNNTLTFLVVQRYLAKDDADDWRLFQPHVNPEALHWRRAEDAIVRIPDTIPDIHNGFHFWSGLGWVGDYFPSAGGDELVSFNIVDTIMGLVKRTENIKYLYHHQEALWNELFVRAFGEERMIELIQDNIVRGWFEI